MFTNGTGLFLQKPFSDAVAVEDVFAWEVDDVIGVLNMFIANAACGLSNWISEDFGSSIEGLFFIFFERVVLITAFVVETCV